MMSILKLEPANERAARPGDFNANVTTTALEVPEEVWQAAVGLSIHNAAKFVSYLHSFPSALATRLGWRIEDVVQARDLLVHRLAGKLPESILQPPAPVYREFGAFPPSWDAKNS